MGSVKNVFLKILQNLQGNTRVGFSFLMKTEACKFIFKKLHHKCFPVNFARFLGTNFFTERFWRLLLHRKIFYKLFNVIANTSGFTNKEKIHYFTHHFLSIKCKSSKKPLKNTYLWTCF